MSESLSATITTESFATTQDALAASSASVSSVIASASSVLNGLASASASAVSVISKAENKTVQPASFKIIGIILAVVSGLFIGASFVFKKKGLISSTKKANAVAGEGHAYLKSPMWWTGMTLMIIGEICNFVAYAFTEALLVTPLGALSVVITAILSSIFLKETLSFFGKIGCFLCLVGATIIALNGPEEQSTSTIKEFQALFLAPGFLVYGSVVILASLGLVFFVAPKYGKKNMMVYITVCSLTGGLSVSCIQGLGSSIITSIRGDNQFKYWFIYFLLGFIVITLVVEINYLNKALELFNTSMVTPTYYVLFTSATLITSVILYQGLKASAVAIITVVFGFLVICCGITLLQMSKVDPTDLKLDRRSTILLSAARQEISDEKGTREEDPGIDAIRGGFGVLGSISRARSARKSLTEASEARRRRTMSHQHDDVEGFGSDGPTTMGLSEIKRHTLYDSPMPPDALERISLHSSQGPHSPTGTFQPPFPSPKPDGRSRAPTIGFAPDVTEHRYPATGARGEATHAHHVIDGPSVLRFPPSYPNAPTSRWSHSGSDKDYVDPYELSVRSATLPVPPNPILTRSDYSTSSPDLTLSDPRLRSKSISSSASSKRGKAPFSDLFNPRRSAEAKADREEREGLVSPTQESPESDHDEDEEPEYEDSIREVVHSRPVID